MAAAFITFEGIDGSGKSTQLRMLASELARRNLEIVITREPGGTPLGARLRHALLDAEAEVDPLAELLLYAADRAQHVRTLIRPHLAANRIVISDRYTDATVAYQGAGRGLPMNLIDQVVGLATDGLQPDLTLVFDLEVAEARLRQTRRTANKADRLDMEDAAFHMRVRAAYGEIARREPQRVRVIDASGTIAETHLRVMQIVELFLAERKSGVRSQESE